MTRCASKKGSHLMFDNNFGKCGPIFKILSPTDSWENAPCFHRTLLGDHQPADQGTNHCVSRAQVTVTYTVNCWFRPIFNFCTSFAPLFEVLLVLWNFQTPNRTGAAVSVNPRRWCGNHIERIFGVNLLNFATSLILKIVKYQGHVVV